jgi:carboxypeptidase C (cathepsin A)
MANDPVAGYVKHLDGFGGFTYAVVRGAGHMVPTDQPERAYDLIRRFVDGEVPQQRVKGEGRA